jgi:hypothetical protein
MLFATMSYSQDLQETLGKLSKDAAGAYVAPIVSGFGANLNSGWVHRVPKAKIFGIDVEFGVVFMGTFFGDNDKTFSANGSFQFNRDQAAYLVDQTAAYPAAVRAALIDSLSSKTFTVGLSGPTIVGSKNDSVKVDFSGASFSYMGTTYQVDPNKIATPAKGFLEELSLLPLAAPQISLGTVYGTSLSFRFLPSIKINDDLGEFKYFGFGIQHNPAMWIPTPLPVEVSVGFFAQSMKVGDVFSTTATTFGVFASRTFGPGTFNITPYAGLSVESSTIEVKYDYIVDYPIPNTKVPITFELKGENSVRFTLGASAKLALFNLSVDYSIAKYNSLSAGLGFVF